MKIAVDARPLSPRPTGIGRYTEQILLHLQDRVKWELLSDKAIFTQLKTAHCHPFCGLGIPRFFKRWLIWQQGLLPAVIRQTQADLFWSPRQQLPLFGASNVPMVLTIHDLVSHKMPETMRYSNYLLEKLLLEKSLRRANHIIAVSESTQKTLVETFAIPEKKITVIHHGYTALPAQAPIDLQPLGITRPFILFLSTLEPRKNVDRLLSAYLALSPNLRDQYQLVLAGGVGWKSEPLLQRIQSLKDSGVVSLGYVNDALIYNLLKQATVFAFPSLYEGFGLPILEAMSMNCPVLTSTDPACVEVSGEAALHVDPLSVDALSNGLQKLLENPSLRQDLIQKGQQNLHRFAWQRSAEAHLAVFKKL